MELFVVTHNSGKIVRSNINSKVEAKRIRKELHLADGVDEDSIEPNQRQTVFTYNVTRGKDHPDVRREANLRRF